MSGGHPPSDLLDGWSPTEVISTGRTEAFSDGVLAIAITLLVLNLAVPLHRLGHLGTSLLNLWPAYVSFLASFVYIGVVWLNHHAAFRRIRSVDRFVMWTNMGVLLGAVILPFPTAVLSGAFDTGNRADEQAAVALYAAVAMLVAAAWLLFFHSLQRRSHHSIESVGAATWRTERRRALPGIIGYAGAGLLGVLVAPSLALGIFVLLPIFYAVTSEGLVSSRRAPEEPSRIAGPSPRSATDG